MLAQLLDRATPFASPWKPLRLADVPAPSAAPGELLVRVSVCAVCRTDLDLAEGRLVGQAAAERCLTTLRFFWRSPQGREPNATGHHGFYYHFLDMQTGRRAWRCEMSTVDSAFLLAGAAISLLRR